MGKVDRPVGILEYTDEIGEQIITRMINGEHLYYLPRQEHAKQRHGCVMGEFGFGHFKSH